MRPASRQSPKRITGRRLQRRRQAFKEADPLCTHCKERGILRLWDHLDHIIPLDHGGEDTEDNLQGLCLDCHDRKTRKENGYKNQSADISGHPADPDHPWNQEQ